MVEQIFGRILSAHIRPDETNAFHLIEKYKDAEKAVYHMAVTSEREVAEKTTATNLKNYIYESTIESNGLNRFKIGSYANSGINETLKGDLRIVEKADQALLSMDISNGLDVLFHRTRSGAIDYSGVLKNADRFNTQTSIFGSITQFDKRGSFLSVAFNNFERVESPHFFSAGYKTTKNYHLLTEAEKFHSAVKTVSVGLSNLTHSFEFFRSLREGKKAFIQLALVATGVLAGYGLYNKNTQKSFS